MNHPTSNTNTRAQIKIIPGVIPLIFSAPQKSFLKPTLSPLRPDFFSPPGLLLEPMAARSGKISFGNTQ
jgi:hypothetical protein